MAERRSLCFEVDFSEHIDGTEPFVCDSTCPTSIQHFIFEKFPSAFENVNVGVKLVDGLPFCTVK